MDQVELSTAAEEVVRNDDQLQARVLQLSTDTLTEAERMLYEGNQQTRMSLLRILLPAMVRGVGKDEAEAELIGRLRGEHQRMMQEVRTAGQEQQENG